MKVAVLFLLNYFLIWLSLSCGCFFCFGFFFLFVGLLLFERSCSWWPWIWLLSCFCLYWRWSWDCLRFLGTWFCFLRCCLLSLEFKFCWSDMNCCLSCFLTSKYVILMPGTFRITCNLHQVRNGWYIPEKVLTIQAVPFFDSIFNIKL